MELTVTLTKKERLGGIIYLVLQFLVLPNVLSLINLMLPHPLSEAGLNIVFFILNFLCTVGIFHGFLLKNLPRTREKVWACLRYACIGFLVYEISDQLLSTFIIWVQPDFANVNDASIAHMAQQHFWGLNFCTVFLVPFSEECLFRGLLFQEPRRHSRVAAYGCSVLLFAFVHVIGYVTVYPPGTLFLCYLQYLPAGICLCWAYEKSDTIFAPILMHMTINQLGILSMR